MLYSLGANEKRTTTDEHEMDTDGFEVRWVVPSRGVDIDTDGGEDSVGEGPLSFLLFVFLSHFSFCE